jgi:hypothetical protein
MVTLTDVQSPVWRPVRVTVSVRVLPLEENTTD